MLHEYRTLFLDALPRMQYSAIREDALVIPSGGCVPFEITPLLPLIDDFFHTHATSDHDGYSMMPAAELPPVVVPYPETWWEWVGRERHDPDPLAYGVHVRAWDSEAIENQHRLRVAADPNPRRSDPIIASLYEDAETRWIFEMSLWSARRKHLHPGDLSLQALRGVCSVLKDGHVTQQYFDSGRGLTHADGVEEKRRGLTGLFAGVLFAMGLLGCKNVERSDVAPPEKLSKKRVRHGGKPLVRYHRLRIRVPGRSGYVDPNAIRGMRGKATLGLHYVRGHFKTFTPEKPLLGRVVGRFYWPPFLRGDAKHGVIGKTYVEEPAPFVAPEEEP